MTTEKTISAPASIPLPSADLITYRFDQVDKQLGQFNKKLDDITNTFAPQKAVTAVEKDIETLQVSVQALIATDNRQQGSIDVNRRFLNITLTVVGIIVGCITTYLGLHR